MPSALDPDLPTAPQARPRYSRWAAIAVASLLLHLAVLDLLPRWTVEPADDDKTSEPLQVTVMPAIAPAEAPPQPTRRPNDVPPRPRPRPRPRIAPAIEFTPQSETPVPEIAVRPSEASGPPVATNSDSSSGPPPGPPTSAEHASGAPVAPAAPATPEPAAVPPSPAPLPAAPPRSARLSYDVVSVNTRYADAVHFYGVGTIDWSIADGRYRSDLRASVRALITDIEVLALHSEGSVAPAGLLPDRYTEKSGRRAAVATNFNRDARQSVTFSASQASVPLIAGVQDRLSILFQIGGLLIADPTRSSAGGRIELPYVGTRGDVEQWIFESLGTEPIDTGAGPLSTTHLRRNPKPGSTDRTIDVWIARQDGGYPARVLYTEPDGSTVDMTLKAIGAVP